MTMREAQRRVIEPTSDTSTSFYKKYSILSFYQFVTPTVSAEQVQEWRDEIETFLRQDAHARGSVLLAVEGINGTICYQNLEEEEDIDPVQNFLRSKFPGLKTRLSFSPTTVFHRLKVRIKNEIVTMGPIIGTSVKPDESSIGDAETTSNKESPPQEQQVVRPVRTGQYIEPGPEWDALLRDPDCLVIDTRNDYEIQLGTFQGAVNLHTAEFPEFPSWLQAQLKGKNGPDDDNDGVSKRRPSKVAMFCTGGIRCEKATAYCLDLLKDEQIPVLHLEGGILAYLDTVPADRSTFQGECFVFDQRTAVTHGLHPTETYSLCRACRHPIHKKYAYNDEKYIEGVCCPFCYQDENRDQRRQRYVDRQKQIELSKKKGIPHMHDAKEKVMALDGDSSEANCDTKSDTS